MLLFDLEADLNLKKATLIFFLFFGGLFYIYFCIELDAL